MVSFMDVGILWVGEEEVYMVAKQAMALAKRETDFIFLRGWWEMDGVVVVGFGWAWMRCEMMIEDAGYVGRENDRAKDEILYMYSLLNEACFT